MQGPMSMTGDERYVAFASAATNLVLSDTNGKVDIFVHDLWTGITARVSRSFNGREVNDDCFDPSFSDDGRYLVYRSVADNIVPFDPNHRFDVFVLDRETGQTACASLNLQGTVGNDHSGWGSAPSISADGRFVSFLSGADDLVPGDTNGWEDIFVRDMIAGQTERISVDSSGAQGDGRSETSWISADGRFVAFDSIAGNLVAGDTNHHFDVFRRDRLLGVTERASLDSQGQEGDFHSYGHGASIHLTPDGRFLAFPSSATNLVPNDFNGAEDVFVRDFLLGTTAIASVASGGAAANARSIAPDLAPDGQRIAFSSDADNLVAGDTNLKLDVFLHDFTTGLTTRISQTEAGVSGNDSSGAATFSSTGDYLLFASRAGNLVPGDGNGEWDAILHDFGLAAPMLARSGACPGGAELAVIHAEPDGAVALLHGAPGSFVKPNGICAGLVLGLAQPQLGASLTASPSGIAGIAFNAPAGACGVSVQAVVVGTCTVTNLVTL